MIALFIISMVFFTTLGVVMNIRDAKKENASKPEVNVNQIGQSEAATL